MIVSAGRNYDSMLDFIEIYLQILSGARDSRQLLLNTKTRFLRLVV